MSHPTDPLGADAPLPDDVPTLQALVRTLLATVAALQREVADLRAEVTELRAQRDRHSGNSSKPPSSDPPWQPRPKKTPTGRKRGGQKGHPGHCRRLVPTAQADYVEVVLPATCQHCGQAFPSALPRRRKFRRWQRVELPPIHPTLTEYQLHARTCAGCHRRTWATLPPGVGRRSVGPRVQAMVALLTGACRLSRRAVQRLLQDLFGLSLSLGTLTALEADTAQALATPYQEVAAAVPQAPVLGVDETSWRRSGTLYWLWTAVTRECTFFRLDPRRNREAYRALLGESPTGESPTGESPTGESPTGESPPGPVLITDRYSAYHHLPPERRSLCWAHLARDFRAVAERRGVDGVVGTWLLELWDKLLEPWRQYRQGTLDRAAMCAAVTARQETLRTPLTWGAEHGSRRTRALCEDLLARWPSLWTWLTVADGEPTNNSAERALRSAVLWRKSSFGHQSDAGEAFVERMLTVVGTLQRQQRNTWDYLVQACAAAVQQQPAPQFLR